MITIDKIECDRIKAQAALKNFMELSQKCFNDYSRKDPKKYANNTPVQIEEATKAVLDEVKSGTPFEKSKIERISGHFFPDIVIDKHYGIEVKSTKENKWTSLGNSIFEGVSDMTIKDIYIMFGNLGSTPPQFKFRPYQDCLNNIAVTHSPRYIIDMEIKDRKEKTIFEEMNTTYDDYRIKTDLEKVALMRAHYLSKSKKAGFEMPWWMAESENVNKLSFFSAATALQKEEIISKGMILFPSLYHYKSDRDKYKAFALWLCTRYGMLLYNVRDEFSASGQVWYLNGKLMEKPYPQIAKNVLDYRDRIKRLLSNPDYELVIDIQQMWDFPYDKKNLFNSWVDMVAREFKNNRDTSFIDIKKHLINGDKVR